MSITAKARSQLALNATTMLGPDAVLAIVKAAAADIKGGGASLLTSGIVNAGAQIHVESEQPNRLALSITSGKRLVELCTFSAQVSVASGRTMLRVGGLERYKTSQQKLLFLIPISPKSIMGLDPYKRFLSAVATALNTNDAAAKVTIAGPTGG